MIQFKTKLITNNNFVCLINKFYLKIYALFYMNSDFNYLREDSQNFR